MSTTPNVVTIKAVTDRLAATLLLEVRLYITTNFDCQLLLEQGNSKRVIDAIVLQKTLGATRWVCSSSCGWT